MVACPVVTRFIPKGNNRISLPENRCPLDLYDRSSIWSSADLERFPAIVFSVFFYVLSLDLGTFGRFCPVLAPSPPYLRVLYSSHITHLPSTSCSLYSTKSHLAMSIQNYSFFLFSFCSRLKVCTQETSTQSSGLSLFRISLSRFSPQHCKNPKTF